jgi:hypothetical protein
MGRLKASIPRASQALFTFKFQLRSLRARLPVMTSPEVRLTNSDITAKWTRYAITPVVADGGIDIADGQAHGRIGESMSDAVHGIS